MPFSFIYSSIKLHRLVERKYFHFELLFIAEEKPKNHCDLLFISNRLKLNGLDYDKLKNIVIIREIMKNVFAKVSIALLHLISWNFVLLSLVNPS